MFSVSLYVAIILGTLLLGGAAPLYYEMACEATYPIAEGVTTFVLTLMNNFGGLAFLGIQAIPAIGITNTYLFAAYNILDILLDICL
jgi:FLVCR family MFS transporter